MDTGYGHHHADTTNGLTTILQLVVQQIHHQRANICHIPTSWHVEMLGSDIVMWQICCRIVVSSSVGGVRWWCCTCLSPVSVQWSLGLSWCLAEGWRNGDQRRPWALWLGKDFTVLLLYESTRNRRYRLCMTYLQSHKQSPTGTSLHQISSDKHLFQSSRS